MHIFLDIKSSGISVKLLYVCVEYFFSDGGSELALGKKNKQKCLVSAFPQFLFLEEQTFCRRVERDVVLKLTTNTEIYCSAVMVWELSMGIRYGYKISERGGTYLKRTSLFASESALLNACYLRIKGLNSSWTALLCRSHFLVLVSYQKRRDSDTFAKNVWNSWTAFQLKRSAETRLYRVAFSLMDCPEDDNFTKNWSEIWEFLPVQQDSCFFFSHSR